MEEVLTILTIYVLCMFKIIFGPTMGYAAGFSPLVSVIITVAGMMTTILIITFLGERIRTQVMQKYFKPK